VAGQLELILGGDRSGKSRCAEKRVMESGMSRVYIATATVEDNEMAKRVRAHQRRRDTAKGDDRWKLIEEPIDLARTLRLAHDANTFILVDCLTLWLSNCLYAKCWKSQRAAFFALLPELTGRTVFVSNEVGLGVVPMGQISREFVDSSGLLHQELSRHCQRVTLMIAGMPMELESASSD